MNWKGWTLLAILIVLVGGGYLAWSLWPKPEAPVPAEEAPVGNLEGKSLYASGEYGFTVVYPERATIEEEGFANAHLPTAWRANAVGTGTPVLAVIPYETESDRSYPRHYVAAVRIGASADPKEVAACEKAGDSAGETALPDRFLNGTAWKAFSFGDAAMMKYRKGVSYRTVRDGKCYALEAMASGSSYRDDPESTDDIADSALEAEYAALDAIVASFAFSAP